MTEAHERKHLTLDAATKELLNAIGASDLPRVREAINAGASVNARISFTVHERFEAPREVEETALLVALRCKTDEIALELLAQGADPHDGGDGDPLVAAVEQGHSRALAAILARPPPPEALAAGLLAAALRGDAELGVQILDAGAEPTVRALCLACSRGAQSLVECLLDRGVDVNAVDGRATPLTQAAWGGDVALVEALLARGADLARDGGPALFSAANAGKDAVVAALLAHGVPADVPNADGWTALMAAAWQDQLDVARRLLAAGANPDHRDARGKSVLEWARESQKRAVVELLESASP